LYLALLFSLSNFY